MIDNRMLAGVTVQGTDETRRYSADITEWANSWGAPTSIESVRLYDHKLKKYVDEKLSDVNNLAGNIFETKFVSGLELPPKGNYRYQLNVIVVFPGGNKLSGWFPIQSAM